MLQLWSGKAEEFGFLFFSNYYFLFLVAAFSTDNKLSEIVRRVPQDSVLPDVIDELTAKNR